MKHQPLSVLQRKRKALAVVQFFYFSGIGCLFPFLSSHMREIGLTTFESAFLSCLTAVAALIAAPISGIVAHKLDKYQTLLVITLIGSGISYTSLLFVPRVIRTPRHPHITYDCTNSQLRMESCTNWEGNCNLKPKLPAIGNYTNFSLTKCKYICPSTTSFNNSWYPMQVCFGSTSERPSCWLHDPSLADSASRAWTQMLPNSNTNNNNNIITKSYQEPLKVEEIQFDSRFDRWPVVSLTGDAVCLFQTLAPLILNHKPFDTIQCKPFVQNCQIQCKVNMIHRPKGSTTVSRLPAACLDVIGNPRITFYTYLVVRSFADLFIFVAYNLLDGLSITMTNDFDSLYAGSAKMVTITLPLMLYPILSGFLVDYYSSQAGQPDYAPPFVLFDGLILITAVLVVAAPASPLLSSSGTRSASATSLRSTASLKALQCKTQIPIKNWYIFALIVIPITLWSGIQLSMMQTHLYPFYIELGVNKLWLGISFATIFITFLPFCLLGKKLVSIGRFHLMLIGLIFYFLKFTSVSLLLHPKYMLIPIESMDAFTFPIFWMGITSYSHHLIKTTFRWELMTRTGLDPSNSNHMRMQYFLNGLHFGVGRVVGCGLWMLWLTHWDSGAGPFNKYWSWLSINDPDFPENDEFGFRIILRLCAIISLSITLPALFFIHIFGQIVSCLSGIWYETKETAVCMHKGCFKCFKLLCCCSCSCRCGKCRLCRRRGKPTTTTAKTATTVKKVMIQEAIDDAEKGEATKILHYEIPNEDEDDDEENTCQVSATETTTEITISNGVTYARLVDTSTTGDMAEDVISASAAAEAKKSKKKKMKMKEKERRKEGKKEKMDDDVKNSKKKKRHNNSEISGDGGVNIALTDLYKERSSSPKRTTNVQRNGSLKKAESPTTRTTTNADYEPMLNTSTVDVMKKRESSSRSMSPKHRPKHQELVESQVGSASSNGILKNKNHHHQHQHQNSANNGRNFRRKFKQSSDLNQK